MKQSPRLAVISPHLDDAVFGCASLIARHAGAAVISVFAGVPDGSEPRSEWDATCGFGSAREAVLVRRDEDRAALAHLDAHAVWLDFLEAQYRHGDDPGDLSRRISEALGDAEIVAIPAGLFHQDHELAHANALRCLSAQDPRRWIVYEDALYRRMDGLLGARIEALRAAGFALSAIDVAGVDRAAKRRAVGCYESQLRGFASAGSPVNDDLVALEGFWELRTVASSRNFFDTRPTRS